MSRSYFAQSHQRLQWLGGSEMAILLDAEATEGQLFVARTRLAAGDASPIHLHHNEDEMFLLLSGHAFFWFGEDEIEARAGAVVYLPRGVPHGYQVAADTDLLTLCTPAGLEAFFRAVGHDLGTERPADWEITPATMAAAAGRLGVEILGPPRLPTPAAGPTGAPGSRI